MKDVTKSPQKRSFCIGAVTLASACAIAAVGCVAPAQETSSIQDQPLRGVAFDAAVSEGDVASGLVAVVATNGRTGYAYREQLEHVEAEVTNPGEAVAYMERLQLQSDETLAQQLTERLPDGASVSAGDAKRFLDVAVRNASASMREGEYTAAWNQGLAELSEALGIPVDELGPILRDAYWAANEAVAERIPVYEADGETQIGEFALGGLA